MKTPKPWESWQDQLIRIHHDPQFNSEHPFSDFIIYHGGYDAGYSAATQGLITPEQIVPPDFNRFVSEYFGEAYPNPKGWRVLIPEHSSSEKEAFELFFRLRYEYEQQRTKGA